MPLLVKWPRHIAPGTVSNAPTITDDVFPTLLNIAGVTNAATLTRGMIGRDLLPLLGRTTARSARAFAERALLWHYPHFWGVNGPGIEPFSALRIGPYKLIYFYGPRRYELYDLNSDLGETTNLFTTHREVAGRLGVRLQRALQAADAQMPIDADTKRAVTLAPLR